MLVGQAREAFEWWTGVRPSAAVMLASGNKLSGSWNMKITSLETFKDLARRGTFVPVCRRSS
jgi:hypothetical protein